MNCSCKNFKLGTNYVMGLLIAIAALIPDQISKILILKHIAEDTAVPVTPFMNLVLVWNKGISFGMFNNENSSFGWIFIVISVAMVLGLTAWLLISKDKFTAISLGLIIGGAVGNIIDRVRLGAVVDFIDVYVSKYHWPAFNIADSCIAIGACIMLFITLKYDEGKTDEASK